MDVLLTDSLINEPAGSLIQDSLSQTENENNIPMREFIAKSYNDVFENEIRGGLLYITLYFLRLGAFVCCFSVLTNAEEWCTELFFCRPFIQTFKKTVVPAPIRSNLPKKSKKFLASQSKQFEENAKIVFYSLDVFHFMEFALKNYYGNQKPVFLISPAMKEKYLEFLNNKK